MISLQAAAIIRESLTEDAEIWRVLLHESQIDSPNPKELWNTIRLFRFWERNHSPMNAEQATKIYWLIKILSSSQDLEIQRRGRQYLQIWMRFVPR
jgi:mannose-6-phosphate isomerase class I